MVGWDRVGLDLMNIGKVRWSCAGLRFGKVEVEVEVEVKVKAKAKVRVRGTGTDKGKRQKAKPEVTRGEGKG